MNIIKLRCDTDSEMDSDDWWLIVDINNIVTPTHVHVSCVVETTLYHTDMALGLPIAQCVEIIVWCRYSFLF